MSENASPVVAVHTIECPSGLVVSQRKILIRDQKVLTDKKLIRSGGVVDALLGACCTQLHSPGIYPFTDTVRWPEVLQGDRLFALVRLRALTHGEHYEFKTVCPACGGRFDYRLNLSRDLRVKILPDSSRETLRAGGVFSAEVDGVNLGFKLLTGLEESRLQQLLRGVGDEKMSASLSQRIVSIQGVEPRNKKAWLEDQDLGFLARVMAAFEEADCGVDNEVEIECPLCQAEVDITVPFAGDFLMPKTRKASQAS